MIARTLRTVACTFLCSLGLLVSAAHAQFEVINVDLGVFGLRTLATLSPSLVYRPIDELGARPGGDALGLGGAYLARAQGATAIGWEPGGLATLDRPMIAIDGFMLGGGGTASGYPPAFEIPGSGSILTTAYSVRPKGAMRANFVAAATPLWQSGSQHLVGALSWRRFLNVQFAEETVNDFIFGDFGGFPVVISLDRKERGGVDAFAPSLAWQPNEMLSVGANLNFLTGRLRSVTSNNIAAGGFATQAAQRISFKYSGFTPDFGGRVSLAQGRVMAAARYTPKYTLEVRGGDYDNVPLAAPGQPQFIIHGKLAGYDLEVPSSFGVGGAIRPLSRIWISADLNTQKWSDAKIEYASLRPALGDADAAILPFRDVSSVHVGLEYEWIRRPNFSIPVRVGYRTAPQSFSDIDSADVSVTDGDQVLSGSKQVEGDAISAGISLHVSNIAFDLGFDRTSYDMRKFYFDSPSGSFTNPSGDMIELTRNVTMLRFSATYALNPRRDE